MANDQRDGHRLSNHLSFCSAPPSHLKLIVVVCNPCYLPLSCFLSHREKVQNDSLQCNELVVFETANLSF